MENKNSFAKTLLLGLSTVIGMTIASTIYKTGMRSIEKQPLLIGDVEEDEIVVSEDDILDEKY